VTPTQQERPTRGVRGGSNRLSFIFRQGDARDDIDKQKWWTMKVDGRAPACHAAPHPLSQLVREHGAGPVNDRVDDAYRKKYRGSSHLGPMIGRRARSATVKVMPRDSGCLIVEHNP